MARSVEIKAETFK